MRFVLYAAASLLAMPVLAGAQALPTASREPIEVGAALSFGTPDYQQTPTYIAGLTAFGTLGLRGRLGAQVELHFDSLHTPIDIGQNTYELGPRFVVLHEDRAQVYVKAIGGLGRFAYQSGTYLYPQTYSYGVFSFGGGVDYRISNRLNVRAIDLEYQSWPGFPGGTLHPVVASLGVAWRL